MVDADENNGKTIFLGNAHAREAKGHNRCHSAANVCRDAHGTGSLPSTIKEVAYIGLLVRHLL